MLVIATLLFVCISCLGIHLVPTTGNFINLHCTHMSLALYW